MINAVEIEGRLTRDAETKTTQNGQMLVTFSVAHNYKAGETEKTDFFNVTAFGYAAKAAASLKKGESVMIRGRLSTSKYQTKDGRSMTDTRIIAQDVFKRVYANEEPRGNFSRFADEDIPF